MKTSIPETAPTLPPETEMFFRVFALTHAAGGEILRTELARAVVLLGDPALLLAAAPVEVAEAADAWRARGQGRARSSATLAQVLEQLADRDAIRLTVDSSSRSLVVASPHTPAWEKLDPWFRFEAKLVLHVLAAAQRETPTARWLASGLGIDVPEASE